MHPSPALPAGDYLRAVAASRATLSRPEMRIVDVVPRVAELTSDARYAVIGGLAQILWARKTHTDDLDIALAATAIDAAHTRVREARAPAGWSLPSLPDRAREADAVFEVCHLLYDGAVVDLIAFKNGAFNDAIIDSAAIVDELGAVRFVRPELLLVTHLLRPGPAAAIAAIELVVARRTRDGIDVEESRRWAEALGKVERLDAVLKQAAALDVI